MVGSAREGFYFCQRHRVWHALANCSPSTIISAQVYLDTPILNSVPPFFRSNPTEARIAIRVVLSAANAPLRGPMTVEVLFADMR